MRTALGLLCALTTSCTADALATLALPGADPLDAGALAADATARDGSARDAAVRDAAVRDGGARDAIVVDAATEEPPSCADEPLSLGVEPRAVAMDSTPVGQVLVLWADARGIRFEELRGTQHYTFGPHLDVEGVLELDRPVRDGLHYFLLMRGGGRGIVLDLADASIRRELTGVMHGLFASEGVARWVRRDDDGRRLYLDTTAPSTELISRGLVPSPAELRGALVSLDEEYLLLAERPRVQEMWAGTEAKLLRALARFTTLRVTISPAVDRAGALRSPASVVVDNCVPHPADADAAAAEGGPRPRYVVASRWNAWKGHRTLIEAWGRAGCPGLLTVLGGPPPSGAKVDVPALVAALADPSSVEIVGEVPDVAPHVAAADALVLPSDDPEPFGLVLLEAFRQGRPVIASRAGGPVDIVTDGRDGWLFTPGDPDALAELLRRLTVDDLAAAGRVARETYLARYTPEVFRRRIGSLIAAELSRVGG